MEKPDFSQISFKIAQTLSIIAKITQFLNNQYIFSQALNKSRYLILVKSKSKHYFFKNGFDFLN